MTLPLGNRWIKAFRTGDADGASQGSPCDESPSSVR